MIPTQLRSHLSLLGSANGFIDMDLFANPGIIKGADFSKDKKQRFLLWRLWGIDQPLMWICLNPSMAGVNHDDPTLKRIMGFSGKAKAGGCIVANLFPMVSTDPKGLGDDPEHTNPGLLMEVSKLCKGVVFGWGAEPIAQEAGHIVSTLFPDGMCLGHNKDGSPKHPLYVPASEDFRRYKA